jgi:hypothetical protein
MPGQKECWHFSVFDKTRKKATMKTRKSESDVSIRTTDITRRDALKLAGVVASLGAGLGVVLEPREASAASGGRLQFKLYQLGENGNETNAELLTTLQATADEENRIIQVAKGRLQLKLFVQNDRGKNAGSDLDKSTLLVKQIIPWDPGQIQGKFGQLTHKDSVK